MPAATPVANGLTVEASAPVPAPKKIIAAATIAVAERQSKWDEQGEEPERLLPCRS